MSISTCALSGVSLDQPVVSKKSGHVYERHVIEKHIEATQTCPFTGQPMTLDDLIPVQAPKTVKPRPVNANSIPNLISILQSEWDALILESFTLKQHLETVRQELSHALYQHDAACRVIARLIKERDEARRQLHEMYDRLREKGANVESGDGAKNGEESGIESELTNEYASKIEELGVQLNTMRKDRKKKGDAAFADFAGQERLVNMKVLMKVALHSPSKPGIIALDYNGNHRSNFYVTGGVDNSVVLYDRAQGKIAGTYDKHTKRINDLAMIAPAGDDEATGVVRVLTASDDHKAHVLGFNTKKNSVVSLYDVNEHSDPVIACAVHPINVLGIVGCRNGSVSFHDLQKGSSLLSRRCVDENVSLCSLKVHPDGMLMAVGASDGTINIWSTSAHQKAAELVDHKTDVRILSFSENGFYLASVAAEENVVKVWDLRSQQVIKVLENGTDKVSSVSFDQSGRFLAIGGKSLGLYNTKTWDILSKFDAHTDAITGIRFGKNSQTFATVSLDRNLIVYG